jgi:hypothetical protein
MHDWKDKVIQKLTTTENLKYSFSYFIYIEFL